MNFNTTTGDFLATFVADTTIHAPTIVFKGEEYHSQNGYNIEIIDKNGQGIAADHVKVQLSAIPHHLEINVVNDFLHGHNITVKLTGKASEEIMQ